MYNKSPRWVPMSTPTPPEVNPYTYILDDPYMIKRVNVVPFASSSSRDTYVRRGYTDALYNIRVENLNKKCGGFVGGHSLRNRDRRFKIQKISDEPAPGSYDLHREKKDFQRTPGKGRLYLCKMPFTSRISTPSIPTKRDAHGYDLQSGGDMKKNLTFSKKDVAGPSTYLINTNSCIDNNPYRGCYWSRRTSKRTMFKTDEKPGPAFYHPEKSSVCRRNKVEEEYREMARRFSYLPRYTEEKQQRAFRENFPSPCQYNVSSYFDYKPQITTIIKPFITREARFKKTKVEDEAIHAIYDTALHMPGKMSPSYKNIPFSVSAERFRKSNVNDGCPGPGLINIKGFADAIIEKNLKRNSLFSPPFDSTNFDTRSLAPPDAHLTPGCATYPREKTTSHCKLTNGTSVFVSCTDRVKLKMSEAPAVSKYSVTEPFNKISSKTSHNKKKLSFNSSDVRKTVVIPLKDNPGPSDYVGKEGIKRNGGYVFTTAKRFNNEESITPPPDHYYIHPLYGESVYGARNTYNLMIAESVLKKKLRLPPSETFEDFMKSLRKKKKLRCFTTFLEE